MPDLVIGGRRSGMPRPTWRAGVIAVAMLGVAVVVAYIVFARTVAYDIPAGAVSGQISSVQSAPGAAPALTYGNASLTWLGGIPVLRVGGDAHTVGAAHGRLLAPWIAPVIRAAAPTIESTVTDDGLLAHRTHEMRVAWRWRFVDDGLVDADRKMVAGMTRGAAASGVPVSFDDVLRGQAILDVGVPSPRTDEAEQKSLAQSLTIIAHQAQAPARLWIARQFALAGMDDGGESAIPVVTIAKPEGKVAWAGVGWPGSLGVVTGVNAHGIAVLVNPSRTADVRATKAARPVALLARTVLESAATLDDAVKMIDGTPTLGAAIFVVVDGNTGAWAQIERTPSKAITERAPKSPVLGDVFTTHALASDPENDRARRMLATQTRIDRAAKLVKNPLPDVGAVAAVLRDRRALDETPRPPGHRGAIDDGRTAHSIILDPATLELWVADPTASGRMRAFDLRHELRGDGDRSTPAADIPAEENVDLDRTTTLRAALADLRIARAALAHDDIARADEAVARARARVPTLPEALELEWTIANMRGENSRARTSAQSWIDNGPDDSKAEERARALIAR
jgi:hypothetical protein